MAKLTPRYTPVEQASLRMLIKPYERWTTGELEGWIRTGSGFRHFTAPNITPIEHFRPKPSPGNAATHPHHTKPAA